MTTDTYIILYFWYKDQGIFYYYLPKSFFLSGEPPVGAFGAVGADAWAEVPEFSLGLALTITALFTWMYNWSWITSPSFS